MGSDAVLLADCLMESIHKNGENLDRAFDAALPTFERKMLNKSCRMVIGSREKAKEMHSSLALQVGRKVQRDQSNGVDMHEVIRTLRERGIGAASAVSDDRGLDAVVAEVMEAVGGRKSKPN